MKYGFIGCGNMGGALARAVAKTTKDILLTDRSGKARELAEELGCGYGTNMQAAGQCERIFLGVKPHMMESVLEPLKPVLQERKPLLISMAAGLEIGKIERFAGGNIGVVRIMPNTPVAAGTGVVLYCRNSLVEEDVLSQLLHDLRFAGQADELEERLMDAGSALSGCGPAYLYMMIEAMADGAVCCGIPRAKALEYAAATMAGAGQMVLATHQHPGQLKDAVCSPGGSTIAGVRALEEQGFRGAVMDAVIAAYHRNQELGK